MRELLLSAPERADLERLARTDPTPDRRERAAALLKIAAGEVAAEVARSGLLRPRDPDTVYSWLDRYQADGLAGLTIRPGRGRKPGFFSPPLHLARECPSQSPGGGPAGPARVRSDGQPLEPR